MSRVVRDIMTADEVAAYLGLARASVYEGASRGEIPHRRVGKRLLFYRAAIEAWLRDTKAGAA